MKKTTLIYSTKQASSRRREKSDPESEKSDSSSAAERNSSQNEELHIPKRKYSSESQYSDKLRRSSSGSNSSSSHQRLKKGERTVKKLRPAQALLLSDKVSVSKCVKTMVDKKTEATLLVDENGMLTGILTDRDIAFKVLAKGLDPRVTRVNEVMTPNPSCVPPNASAIDALRKMVSGQFRHLPVADDEKVVGILDIAKCLYDAISKIEQAYGASSDRFSEAVRKLEKQLPGSAGQNLFEKMRDKLFLPTLSAIIEENHVAPVVDIDATATEAAQMMFEKESSAVIVCDHSEHMVGILTSKDLMRRVVALDLDPTLCEVKSIMTANPYYATLDTTILETLHTMHNGKFLHVPVFNKENKLVGLADVLQVTCGVVQQMGSFQRVRNDSVESLWTQFRKTMLHSDESGEGGDIEDCGEDDDEEEETKNSSVMIENQNASFSTNFTILSQTNETNNRHQKTPESDNQEKKTQDVFVYKLADCYGNNHRFTSSAESVSDLLRDVQKRLGDHTIQQIHYVDDEWEHVLLFTDNDLKDAVKRARLWGNKYIRLIIPHLSIEGRGYGRGIGEKHLGIVYYAAAAAALAGASFLLTRRR